MIARATVAQDVSSDSDAILDGALAAFLDFGVRRTNMAEIARRAGISPATLYRRYSQKSDLVAAVGLREATRVLARLDKVIDTEATPLEQLTLLYTAVSDEVRSNDLLHRLLATEPESVLPKLTVDAEPILAIGREYLASFLTRLQAEGHLPGYDVRPVADVLTRLTQSELLTPSTEPLTPRQVRAFVRDHLAPFIRLSPEGAPR
jgi:AcrR family transcriptional regulator